MSKESNNCDAQTKRVIIVMSNARVIVTNQKEW